MNQQPYQPQPPLLQRWPWCPNADPRDEERIIYSRSFVMTANCSFRVPPPAEAGMQWTGIRVLISNDMHRPSGIPVLPFQAQVGVGGEHVTLHFLEGQWAMLPMLVAVHEGRSIRVSVPMPFAEQFSGAVELLAQRI